MAFQYPSELIACYFNHRANPYGGVFMENRIDDQQNQTSPEQLKQLTNLDSAPENQPPKPHPFLVYQQAKEIPPELDPNNTRYYVKPQCRPKSPAWKWPGWRSILQDASPFIWIYLILVIIRLLG